MKIDWADIGSVFGVSLVCTVGLVVLFTVGISGLSHREKAAARGESLVELTQALAAQGDSADARGLGGSGGAMPGISAA